MPDNTKKAGLSRAGRMKLCRICQIPFRPLNSLQRVCGPSCAILFAVEVGDKERQKIAATALREAAKAKREGKAKLMTRSDWIKKAQTAFNAYIRERDKQQPCICCGKPLSEGGLTGGGYDAGHYRSVGSAPHLRFEPDNCHGQNKRCNQWGAGRAVDYRIGLINRIGLARVEALEADQSPRKWTIEQLQDITKMYREKLKGLKNDRR